MKLERMRNAAQWDKFNQFVRDCAALDTPVMRSFGAIHYLEPMTEDYEYRYEQRGDEYTIRSWHNGTEKSHRGLVDNMPEWLRAILATARVAGAIKPIKEPPPEIILWFRTDDKHNLNEFIEMK